MAEKVYEVSYKYGYSFQSEGQVNVLAKSAAEAVDHVRRYGKKNHYSEVEVVGLRKVLSIDVSYKSPSR